MSPPWDVAPAGPHQGETAAGSGLSLCFLSAVLCSGGMYHGDMTDKLKLLYKLHLPQGKVPHVALLSVRFHVPRGVFASFLSVAAFCPEETASALDAATVSAANIPQGKNVLLLLLDHRLLCAAPLSSDLRGQMKGLN